MIRAAERHWRCMEKRVASLQPVVLYGAGKRSRTPDLRITNALLYQLSYAGVPGAVRSMRRKRRRLYVFLRVWQSGAVCENGRVVMVCLRAA